MMCIGDILGIGMNDTKALDLTQPHLLRFDKDSSGCISSIIDNRKVYRNKDSEDCIRAGECWLCTLTYNPKGNNYFASGLRMMDLEDIVPLGDSIISELAEYLLEYAPSSVEKICMPSMDEKVASIVEERLEEERKAYEERITSLESQVSERDTRIAELEDEENAYEERITSLESQVSERDTRIAELEDEVKKLNTRIVEPKVEVPTIPTFTDFVAPEGIMRLSDNEVCSRSFEDGCYRVRFSINGRRMTIVRDPEGEVRCRNNVLCIPHLELLLPFNGPCRMIHKEVDNGMTVSLL